METALTFLCTFERYITCLVAGLPSAPGCLGRPTQIVELAQASGTQGVPLLAAEVIVIRPGKASLLGPALHAASRCDRFSRFLRPSRYRTTAVAAASANNSPKWIQAKKLPGPVNRSTIKAPDHSSNVTGR